MSWKKVNVQMPTLAGHSANVCKEKLYIFGGDDEMERTTNELHEFDIESEIYSQISCISKPPARSNHTSNIINDYLYVFGGSGNGDSAYNDLWRYSIAQRQWEEVKPQGGVPFARASHSSVVYENRYIVIYGGWDFGNFFSDIWAFDVVENVWRELKAANAASEIRVKHRAAIYNNQMIIVGGEDKEMYLQNSVFKCTLMIESFTYHWETFSFEYNQLPDCYGHQLILFDQLLFIFGGYAGEFKLLNDLYLIPLSIVNGAIMTSDVALKRLKISDKPEVRYSHSLSFYLSDHYPFARLYLFGGVSQDFGIKFNTLHYLSLDFLDDLGSLQDSSTDKDSNPWNCPACTFINTVDDPQCSLCGTPNTAF